MRVGRNPIGGVYRYKVLVVEDDRDVREVVWALLMISGFQVEEAKSAAAAIALVKSLAPDVVVSDWDLGDESSEKFLLYLAGTMPQIGRVLLSASPGRHWQELIDEGVVHVALAKPFDRTDLVAAIHKAIASATSR